MRILLDECVTKRLKSALEGLEVLTVAEMKWNGVKNGKLLALCEENSFDILLTIDKNIVNQQNIEKFNISIVVFNSSSSKLEELEVFIPAFKANLNHFEKRIAYVIDKQDIQKKI
ncbi:DUF5615 family PIN-like protein [Raineya orbicola]|jgi:hypothetical protein|uniref:DUF5615 domain-containing protein n=1 Tax=Raineya orbicola TaxID=2016530 RepID=A0A2N3IKM4_9BACT|nr:DUF5615 family PIN-like protein [Raineya orbicola]PKQ70808.1 hypothetical protein Rain11_0154 [Raineya orbicola]